MSRSGYSDDINPWQHVRWRGAVKRAIEGKHGQAFLKEMLAALDALPQKRLIQGAMESDEGEVCALGAVGRARGMSMDVMDIDPFDWQQTAAAFGIPYSLACEIMWMNDDEWRVISPEILFIRMREWVLSNIRETNDERPSDQP